MANIYTAAISGTTIAITATQWESQVTVQELPTVANFPTVQLQVYKPSPTGGAATGPRPLSLGQSYTFFKGDAAHLGYRPGDIVGYVSTVTGSSTLVVDEGGS